MYKYNLDNQRAVNSNSAAAVLLHGRQQEGAGGAMPPLDFHILSLNPICTGGGGK